MSKLLRHVIKTARILYTSLRRYGADEHTQRAVALTYYTLFAIVPLAALTFGIAKGFDLENRLRLVLDERFAHHQELLKYVYQFADTTLKQASGGLVAGVGVIALIWTVVWLAGNIEKSFNAVWGLPARKNIFRKFSDYLSIVLLIPIFLVVLSSAGVFLRTFFENVGQKLTFLGSAPGAALSFAGNVTPLVLVILLFSVIYYTAPNTKVKLYPALLAGITAGICFQILQDTFLFLQGSIYRYNRIYGSFAALPLFLIWMQWSWQIVLFGAEVGFVAQKIDTGLFAGGGIKELSPRSRRVEQLALTAVIYRNFANGLGSTSFGELGLRTGLSDIVLLEELEILTAAGLVLRAAEGENSYLPALPPEKTMVLDCCRRLDQPDGLTPVFGAEELVKAQEVLENFDKIQGTSQSNRKIFEL